MSLRELLARNLSCGTLQRSTDRFASQYWRSYRDAPRRLCPEIAIDQSLLRILSTDSTPCLHTTDESLLPGVIWCWRFLQFQLIKESMCREDPSSQIPSCCLIDLVVAVFFTIESVFFIHRDLSPCWSPRSFTRLGLNSLCAVHCAPTRGRTWSIRSH